MLEPEPEDDPYKDIFERYMYRSTNSSPRNHLYLSPTGHQVKGWINSQVAFIGSYETGKMIMVAATLKVKHVTLELGEEVLFEYADFDKRQQRDQFKYGRGIKKKGRSIQLTSSRKLCTAGVYTREPKKAIQKFQPANNQDSQR